MNITENNKIIAEFMGIIYMEKNKLCAYLFPNGTTCLDTELKYHSDWNWLMEVVEKIENLEYINRKGRFSIGSTNFEENYTAFVLDCDEEFIQEDGEIKIISVYNVVIEFIKWYNQKEK